MTMVMGLRIQAAQLPRRGRVTLAALADTLHRLGLAAAVEVDTAVAELVLMLLLLLMVARALIHQYLDPL